MIDGSSPPFCLNPETLIKNPKPPNPTFLALGTRPPAAPPHLCQLLAQRRDLSVPQHAGVLHGLGQATMHGLGGGREGAGVTWQLGG